MVFFLFLFYLWLFLLTSIRLCVHVCVVCLVCACTYVPLPHEGRHVFNFCQLCGVINICGLLFVSFFLSYYCFFEKLSRQIAWINSCTQINMINNLKEGVSESNCFLWRMPFLQPIRAIWVPQKKAKHFFRYIF